jgi:LEA14-like dessication related protein
MERKGKAKRWIIAIVIILLIGVGVIAIFFNPKKGLKLVLPDLDDITLVNAAIENDTAYVGVDMVLENKSIFKIDLDTLFYKVVLADSILFNQTQVLNIRQKSGDVNTFKLPLKIPISKTMHTIRSLQNQDSTYIEIHSYIVYNTIFGTKKIPVSKKVKIKVPVPPEIKVNKVEIDKVNIGSKTVDLKATVTIVNKGELLDLNIHEVAYHLVLGEDLVTSDGVYNKPITVKPLSETRVEIPVTVKVNHIVKTAWKYVTNDEVPYHIDVKAQLDENSFYHKSNIPVEAKAKGKAKLRGK